MLTPEVAAEIANKRVNYLVEETDKDYEDLYQEWAVAKEMYNKVPSWIRWWFR